MIFAKRIAASVIAVLTVFSVFGYSQPSTLDPTFAPVPSLNWSADDLLGKGVAVGPDGKPVIWGGNIVVDGFAKGRVARLNVDGSVDNTFNYCNCLLDELTNAEVQTDGKVLIAGSRTGQARVYRLNLDGSEDVTFSGVFNVGSSAGSNAAFYSIQSDGKILVLLRQYFAGGFHQGDVLRLNSDGSIDAGFTPINYDAGRLIGGSLEALAIDAAGRYYVAITVFSGPSTTAYLRRHNADGTLDNSWTEPNVAPASKRYFGLAVEPDGSLLISGQFSSVNGVGKSNLVRILPAGNVDLNFTAAVLGTAAGQLQVLPGGKILVGYYITGQGTLTRVNHDGSPDGTFILSPTVSVITSKYVVDPMGRILFVGVSSSAVRRLFRLNPNGDADGSFNPNVTKYGSILSLAIQSDGKVLLGGSFSQLNGTARAMIGRVNTDGTLDPTFDPGSGFNGPPSRLVVQSDGKIIAAGSFTSYNGSARAGLVRINPDGGIDASFNPTITGGSVLTVSLQTDGRILIGGSFTMVDGSSRTGVARLSSGGVLDNVFNPIIGNPSVTEIFQQADGKIMVGGGFSGVNGFNRSGMVRLNDDGSLDMTFDATGVGTVTRIWPQPDGKYIVDGNFTVRRRNANGSADSSFISPVFEVADSNGRSVDTVIVQPDGTLIVGGRFDTVNGVTRRNLIRLRANGVVDKFFFPLGADGPVRASLRQPDGKVIIGGEFGKVSGANRDAVARLNVAPFQLPSPFDFDGDGRADISVVRPSTDRWYELFSGTGAVYEETFGLAGDILAPADFDGDGITDEAIYRPSNGQWWFRSSVSGGLVLNVFGLNGDIPRPSDFDGDGKADFVLFRPSNNTWYRIGSLTPQQQATPVTFGLNGDQPLVGDFDGDGKGDIAVFRPSNGDWWYAATSADGAFRTVHWGQTGDIPVPADYDGDGKTDYAVYRPSEGGWYIYNSSNGSFTTTAFGINTDRPVAADYDGDGRADIAVFRPSTGIWYLLRTTSGFAGYQFGISTDIALPGALIP